MKGKNRNRRAAQKRRTRRLKYSMIGLVTVLLIAGLLGGHLAGNTAFASSDNTESNDAKYYQSITIESGDTLWSLSEQYRTEDYESNQDYIDELMRINNLNDEKLIEGEKIIIVYDDTI